MLRYFDERVGVPCVWGVVRVVFFERESKVLRHLGELNFKLGGKLWGSRRVNSSGKDLAVSFRRVS